MRPMLTIVAVCALMLNQWPAQDMPVQAEAPVEALPYDASGDLPTLEAEKVCVDGLCETRSMTVERPILNRTVTRTVTQHTPVYRAYPIAGAPVRAVGRVARGTVRVGAAVTRGVVRVATAPVRLVGRVLANGVERRQERRANRRAAGRGLFGCRC